MSRGPVLLKTGAAAADNATVIEIASSAEDYDTWILGSTAGPMDVFVSLNGTDYLATAIALIDLNSTAPATAVIETTAGGTYGFKGRYRMVKVLQKGATAVVGAGLVGYNV